MRYLLYYTILNKLLHYSLSHTLNGSRPGVVIAPNFGGKENGGRSRAVLLPPLSPDWYTLLRVGSSYRASMVTDDEVRCPECGMPIESREPLDRFQNTRIHPCKHIVGVEALEPGTA